MQIKAIISTNLLEPLSAVVKQYNAAKHILMHNMQRQFCYSTPASRPTLHLRWWI